MIKEFKKFIFRGNVIDLAVAVIIGASFNKIVTSIVSDLIMPVIGVLTGRVNFNNMFIVLGKVPEGVTVKNVENAANENIPIMNYGALITSIIDFLIIAVVLFMIVKLANRISEKAKPTEVPSVPTTKKCEYCKNDINIGAVRCPYCTSVLSGIHNEEGVEEIRLVEENVD